MVEDFLGGIDQNPNEARDKLVAKISAARQKRIGSLKILSVAEILLSGSGKLREEADIRARISGDRISLSDVFDIEKEIAIESKKKAALATALQEFDEDIDKKLSEL